MSEYILRSDAAEYALHLPIFSSKGYFSEYDQGIWMEGADDAQTSIAKHLATIPCDPDVVKKKYGKWETVGVGITERVRCSNCKSTEGSFGKPPFCNQCGADMRGEGHES